ALGERIRDYIGCESSHLTAVINGAGLTCIPSQCSNIDDLTVFPDNSNNLGKLARGSISPFSETPTTTPRSLIQVGWPLLTPGSTPRSVRTPSCHIPTWFTRQSQKQLGSYEIGRASCRE